jgi:glycosyltransferase involved in cell wall biosynthesis
MLEMHIVRKADAVITIGDELASLIARTYKIPKPYVIMNCPRYRRVLARNEQLLAAQLGLYSKRIVLYAGSITHNNGLEELIQAFDLLRDLDDVVGVLMGPITSRGFDKYLKALIERLGLRERVFILEPVRPEQVVTYAATAHVGVIPIQKNCLNHHYALPNKFFEYIMARLPIASSDLPNVRRLVEQYQIGVIFDERDPSSIASAIRRLLVDQTFYQQVKNNLNQIAEKFSWERQAEKLLRVYQTLGL